MQKWVAKCNKPFDINVIGISYELASLYCASEGERKLLVEKVQEYKDRTKDSIKRLMTLRNEINSNDGQIFSGATSVLRLFLFQNCNEEGRGLNLDKNTLIKILGEYSILVSECDATIFPLSVSVSEQDMSLFGLSELWFNPSLFEEKLLKYAFIYLLDKERINTAALRSSQRFLDEARQLVESNRDHLWASIKKMVNEMYANESSVPQDKNEYIAKFKSELAQFTNRLEEVLGNPKLSLPEKRALIALLIREDDSLFDDELLVQELPTLDDVMSEAMDLYIETNNQMSPSVLSGPQKEGKIFNPNAELKSRLADLRKSYAFIRKSRKRLKEIENSQFIEQESKKLLTEKGFTYGNATYRLQHDVVEKPLKADYHPNISPSKEGVDLRSGFSPIRNQGPIGSCSAFSTSSIFEFIINEANQGSGKIVLSPRFLYYNVCDKNDDGTPIDEGSSFFDTIQSLGQNGICKEGLCVYSDQFSEHPSQEAYEDAKSRLVTEAKNVKLCDIKAALTEGYPVAISLKIFDSFGKGKKGFVFRPTPNELQGSDYGHHAMVICGYSEKDKVYIVRNSWGKEFGVDGYCYIPFSYIEDESLCCQAIIITGVSCAEIAPCEIFADQPAELDVTDKDIEYAVLRIKIEEEEVSVQQKKRRYNELYRDYQALLIDLGNTPKRQKIIDEALKSSSNFSLNGEIVGLRDEGAVDTTVVSNLQPKFSNNLLGVGAVAFLCFALITFYLKPTKMEALPFILVAIAVIMGMLCVVKKAEKTDTIVKEKSPKQPVCDMKAITEAKYLMAGMLIDKLTQVRNDYVNKHSCLVSFVRNLQQWYGEVKESISKTSDKLKVPFVSLFDEATFQQFFDNNKDQWTKFNLYDDFRGYSPNEQAITNLKDNIFEKLGKAIDISRQSFSMCKYLTQSEQYPYLPQVTTSQIDSWLKKLVLMSLPFGQIFGKSNKPANEFLLLHVKDETQAKGDNHTQEQWNELKKKYCSSPLSGEIFSALKLIYVQVHEVSLDDLKIMEQYCIDKG